MSVEPDQIAIGIAARCWCDKETENIEMDGILATAFAKRVQVLLDALEHALNVTASANWDHHDDWHAAAEKQRVQYNEIIGGMLDIK